MNGDCGVTILPGELVDGFPFEPRCLVLVLAPASERIMFDEMMAAGRKMSDPFEVAVNFTVATGSAPDVKTVGTNCGNSRVLLQNYERDRVGQDVRDALQETRASISTTEQLIAFWDRVQNSRAMVSIDPATGLVTSVLPPSSSPPPPPPPVLQNAPPAPPEQVSNAVQTQRLADELVALELRRDTLVASLDGCFVPSRPSGVVCGLNSNEVPDPIYVPIRTCAPPTLPFYAHDAGTRSVDGTQQCKMPRICDAPSARTRLLRMCARLPTIPRLWSSPTLAFFSQTGIRRSTRSPPTASCARSCWRWARIAFPRTKPPSTAPPVPRARNGRASTTSSTWRATTAVIGAPRPIA